MRWKMTNLEKYLYQLRRIEKHREATAEKEIRKIYKELLKELNGFLGNIYATYSEDDMLNYAMLAKAGADARFLEEVEQRINGISPKVAKQIQETVQQTYEACYDGMRNAVVKAAGNRELLQQAFKSVSAVTPDVIKQAVNNPVSGLTLKDTLEKHRKEIIYDIKRNIGVGLTNGDRYSTMARRIAESLDGDYNKAIRIARTETHRVRESGFNDAATAINDTLKQGTSGYVMAKTWRTMQDERVRPLKAKGKSKKYNHVKMDGVTIPQDELFVLPSGATCKAPSQTGVAGEDINCRCYLSYDLVLASELTKVQDGTKTIEEAAKVENATAPDKYNTDGLKKIYKGNDKLVDKAFNAAEKDVTTAKILDNIGKLEGGITENVTIKRGKSAFAPTTNKLTLQKQDDLGAFYHEWGHSIDYLAAYKSKYEKEGSGFHWISDRLTDVRQNAKATINNTIPSSLVDIFQKEKKRIKDVVQADIQAGTFSKSVAVTIQKKYGSSFYSLSPSMQKYITDDLLQKEITKAVDKLTDNDKDYKAWGAVSDIFDAITSGFATNRKELISSHGYMYWEDIGMVSYTTSGNVRKENTEILADFIELKLTGSKKQLKYLEDNVPELYKELNSTYEEIADILERL